MSKFCSKCGQEVMDEAVCCPHCGCKIPAITEDNPNPVLSAICVLQPQLGVLICIASSFMNRPNAAKSYGLCALSGFLIGICLFLLFVLL